MQIIWQTFGHKSVKNILDKQLSSGKLSHAYLFAGPESVGKKSLAFEFAKNVLSTEKLENHPDFQILDAEGEIVMEQVLEFISKTAFKPFLGSKKIAIINNAQNLNIQSGNALLKTLEEPSDSSIIILIAGPGKMLPTIVSRASVLNFSAFSKKELGEFAAAHNLEATSEILDLSFGRPGRLKKLNDDKEFFSRELNIIEDYKKLRKQPLGEKLAGLSDFAEIENSVLEQNLLTWLFWQSQELQHQPKEFFKVQAITDAFLNLKKNYNKKLVLQGLLMKI